MNAPPRIPIHPRRRQVAPYMSTSEVARLFGVSATTVGEWGARGYLTRTRPRPRSPWRYAEGEVLALYERQLEEIQAGPVRLDLGGWISGPSLDMP